MATKRNQQIDMNKITLKGIIDEDFVNYKIPSMVLMFPYCTFKCGKFCQNYALTDVQNITTSISSICERYINNKISRAIVCQGLEPLDSFTELYHFVCVLRQCYNNHDDVVIYTGYTEEEVAAKFNINLLAINSNIIIKYGRYIPNQNSHFDDILGVNLASDNQYAKRIGEYNG